MSNPCLPHPQRSVEVGAVIGKGGRDIRASEAIVNHVAGYVLALDLTDRKEQTEAKSKSLPWTIAKGADTFTPISSFIPASHVHDPALLEFWLGINGKRVQQGCTQDMLFALPELIAFISRIMRLEEGDLILTGTPAGAGPIVAGQVLHGGIRNIGQAEPLATMSFPVMDRIYRDDA